MLVLHLRVHHRHQLVSSFSSHDDDVSQEALPQALPKAQTIYSSLFSASSPMHCDRPPKDAPILAGPLWSPSLWFGQAFAMMQSQEESPTGGSWSFSKQSRALLGCLPRWLPDGHAPNAFITRSSRSRTSSPHQGGVRSLGTSTSAGDN